MAGRGFTALAEYEESSTSVHHPTKGTPMTKHICSNATFTTMRYEHNKKGEIVAAVYTCVCGGTVRRKA